MKLFVEVAVELIKSRLDPFRTKKFVDWADIS